MRLSHNTEIAFFIDFLRVVYYTDYGFYYLILN